MDTKNEKKPAATETATTAAPEAPATETKPATEAPEAPKASAKFPIKGVITLRGDGQVQSGFNLVVSKNDEASVKALEALAAHPTCAGNVDVENGNGEIFVSVKCDAKSKQVMKKARAFDVLVTGELRVTGVRARQFRGELIVTTAEPADILNGGRIVEPSDEAIERREERRQTTSASGGRAGLRGFRI